MRRYLVRVMAMKEVYVIAEDEEEACNEAEKIVANDHGIDPHDIVDSEILEDSAVDKEDLYEG